MNIISFLLTSNTTFVNNNIIKLFIVLNLVWSLRTIYCKTVNKIGLMYNPTNPGPYTKSVGTLWQGKFYFSNAYIVSYKVYLAWVDIRHQVLFPAMSHKRLIDDRTFWIFELLVDRGLFTFMYIGLGIIKVVCRDFIPSHQWNINN